MSSVRAVGLTLIFLGLVGFAIMYGAQDVMVSGYAMAFKAYPLSVKTAEEKISPTLKEEISKVSPDKPVRVVLKLTGSPQMSVAQQQLVLSQVQALGFVPTISTNYVANTMAGTIPAGNVNLLAQNPYIDAVLADVVIAQITADVTNINFLSESAKQINANVVWQKGITGEGVTVIEIDSGIANSHPALIRDSRTLVLEEKSFVPDAVDYTHWHGTHVAGIIASQDPTYRGVAPGIKGFVDIIAFDQYGNAYLSWVLGALDYAYKVADRYKPAVCTNSWGGMAADTPEWNEVRKAALRLAEKIPVVFAAGNTGPASGTIAAPGDADEQTSSGTLEVITVGAVDKSGNVASFSARGPDSYGIDRNEPDIVAPGVSITSTVPPSGFRAASGTSMATPHVTGVVALMLSKNPNLSDMDVLEILEKTAKDAGTAGFDYSYGYGIVQADKAVDAVSARLLIDRFKTEDIISATLTIIVVLGAAMVLFPSSFEGLLEVRA